MKSSNGGSKSVHILDKQHDRKSKTSEMTDEEDKFNSLAQMGRDLAHQLNNLLTTILANTQLMSLIVKDEELGSYLRVMEDATRDAGATVRDFQRSIRALATLPAQEDTLDGTQRPNTEE